MVPSNDYSLDIERENAILILPQQDNIFGKFDVLGELHVYYCCFYITAGCTLTKIITANS